MNRIVPVKRRFRQGWGIVLFVLIALSPVIGGPVAAAEDADTEKQMVSIDFNDVDITVFIKFISELTGKNFIVDDRVRGKVTVLMPSKISTDTAYKVFESVLDVHGFAAVESGAIIKIVPSPDARTRNMETLLGGQRPGEPQDRIITQLIPLKYAQAEDIRRLFAPLISKSSVILAYPETNHLIVTDYQSNLAKLLRILAAIDVEGSGQEISVIPVIHAKAENIVKLLTAIYTQRRAATRKGSDPGVAKFVSDERTNAIVMLASELETRKIRELIELLDQKAPPSEERIKVRYLEYANAEELATVLQSLSSKQAPAEKDGKQTAPVISKGVMITADKATNSLIISADREDYQTLEEIIRQLDIPRAMVYIEALIMEVNLDKNFTVGTEWRTGEDFSYGSKVGVLGGNYAPEVPGLSALGTDKSLPLLSGMTLGIFTEAITVGGIQFANLQAVINAFKQDKDVNIISTPQILTTDNEEAKITVGRNLPFQTTTSTTDNNTYNSFEYRDVGKTLQITPQISKDRMVRLSISLEVTDLESTTDSRPTTLKRAVNTTVIVKDAETVVIGGLIEDNQSRTVERVPCLGDVPVLTYAFSNRNSSGTKTNMYVFLTPHVIRDPEEAVKIYGKKRDQIENIGGRIQLYGKETDFHDSNGPPEDPSDAGGSD